jgi:hypothetical protein
MPPPAELVAALERRGVAPLSVGRVIIATWEPHQNTVLDAIHELGLERQVIFNKGAVMVLPSGVNKASGLTKALERCTSRRTTSSGWAMPRMISGFSPSAIAGSRSQTRSRRSRRPRPDHQGRPWRGVIELIDALLADDLASLEAPAWATHRRRALPWR